MSNSMGIRKSGWLIFSLLFAALLALIYLLAGPAIRLGMVYSLEKTSGAEVNIDSVSLQLAPLAINVKSLQITDAAAPERNVVSFAHANAAVELWPALLGYYVIDDLSVEGLQYGASRQQPGKVYRVPGQNDNKLDLASVLQVDLPDADELIARANLQTPAKAEALKQLVQAEQQKLRGLKDNLPGKAQLEQYQNDIKALTDSKVAGAADLAAKAEQLSKLKQNLTAEQQKVLAARDQLSHSQSALTQAVTELHQASKADYANLQQLANLSGDGLAGISQILLGDIWAARISQLQSLYLLAKPYLPADLASSAASTDTAAEVVLPNRVLPLPNPPYPDFWVKQAKINWLFGGAEATISMQDVTAQHALIGRPTRFSADVSKLPQLNAFKLAGDFAVMQQMVTNISWQLDGLSLSPTQLGNGDSALALAGGVLSSDGKLNLTDNQIAQQAKLVLSGADFSSSGNKYLQQLAGLLNKQTQIPLSLNASGLISQPEVSIRSSLDKVLGDALLGEAKQKVAQLQTELQSRVEQQLNTGLAPSQSLTSLLGEQNAQLNDISGSIEQMLSAKLAGGKDQLKDKLLNKLGGN